MPHFHSHHDEGDIGKAYDSRLMKRLLSYARPFWGWMVIAIFLLLVITGTELVRPYLVKMAIDNYITAYDRPLIAVKDKIIPGREVIKFRGLELIRENYTDHPLPGERYQLIQEKGDYILIHGVIDRKGDYTVIKSGDNYTFISPEGIKFPGTKVTREELKELRKGDIKGLINTGIIYFGIISLGFFLGYLQIFILQYTGQKIIHNLRAEVFTHLQRLSLSFFDKNPVGRLVTRVTNDIETLNEMYTSVLVNLFKDIFLLSGIIIVMLRMNTRLALISFSVIPFIFISTFYFRKLAREAYRLVRVKLAKINAFLSENISGITIVQVFNREAEKNMEFERINREHLEANKKHLLVYAVFRPVIEFLQSLALALIIWYGGGKLLSGELTFGIVYAFITYINQFFHPINELTEKYNILQSAMASSERIFLLLDQKEDIKNPTNPKPLTNIKGEIEFKHVWFAYNEGEWVLKDVSFRINPGETVAIVGATGAGKTSIINLINRFYDVQKGEILIDGINIKDVKKEDLRKYIGIVLQDVFLFTGDIKSNIRLRNPKITDEEVVRAAEYVNAHKFIESLPKKYDEDVKERGATLSSGQRQLLAFARALAFNPAILVLDEATSNIDTETEILIQEALSRLIKGRTTIIIAHRLSTIQKADKIIVLHKGRIREMGTHQELLAKHGIYYNLYRLQYKEDFNGK